MRVAYDWSRETWRRIYAKEGEGEGPPRRRRGWVEGDSRDEQYRGRIGAAYQAEIEEAGWRKDEDEEVEEASVD